jgi:hypothetical protein
MSKSLKLAITKIGDLLLHNKITQDEEGMSITDISLVIPNYQRPYKWTAKNVIQLLDDIINAKNENKETYRVGTLILHFDNLKSTYNIVDGQQRTITFSLLLKALMDSYNRKQSIKNENQDESDIKFLGQNLADNPYSRSNIPNNFRILERRADNMGNNMEQKELLDYIKNNCEIIVVITEDISEAFQFFDSQNARGKKLYPHDLLKAYHLREMKDFGVEETEKVVKGWEDLPQKELSSLFAEYLYRIKEWTKGNRVWELTEQNIHKFKGITRHDNFPYAQFFKGAFAYADMVNQSSMPFVSGMRNLKPFQLDTPIVAGKPFFDYTKHYFEILKDIQNNDKYEGYFINDNEIVKTLNLRKFKNGVGNRITRLLFDTSILLFVDRFSPTERPSKIDLEMLDQFVVFAFIWSYSLRAQYTNLGWLSAQNYIMGNPEITNSFNIYKTISDADSPVSLISELSDKVSPLQSGKIVAKKDNVHEKDRDDIYQNYLHYFEKNKFINS